MDTNKLENKGRGQTMISDQSHRLIESNSKKYRIHCQKNDNTHAIKVSVNENFSTLLDFVFFGIFGMSGS